MRREGDSRIAQGAPGGEGGGHYSNAALHTVLLAAVGYPKIH